MGSGGVRAKREARAARAAARRAEEVIGESVARVVARRRVPPNVDVPLADEEPPSPSSPQGDQAAECKRLRDGGMAWWQIGQQLGLAGTAASAGDPEAKRGAGAARRLYAAANRGEVPRTHAPRKGSTPKPSGPGRSGTIAERKTMLVEQGHVIPRDMNDEEVQALLVGRTIEWAIDMARLTGTDPEVWGSRTRWVKQDARVHVDPKWVYVSTDEDSGERTVRFREYAGFDTDRQKHMSGPTRVVRVDAIYTIR